MNLPPVTQFTLRTSLPIDAVKEYLKNETGELSWGPDSYQEGKEYNSKIEGNEFTLRTRPGGLRKQGRLITKGKIEEGTDGLQHINITVRGTWFQIVLWPVLLFLGVRNVMVLVKMLGREEVDIPQVLFTILVFAFLLVFIYMFFIGWRNFVVALKKFLIKTWQAEEVQ